MENTNKMKNLANDLKAFEQMMKEQRNRRMKLKKDEVFDVVEA